MADSWRRQLDGWRMVASGKTRELYRESGRRSGDYLLVVGTDRISTFGRVVPTPIPDKGEITTQISLWWLNNLREEFPNHLVSTAVPAPVERRAIMAHSLRMLPYQLTVYGYLGGKAWRQYESTGALWGHPLPQGLRQSGRLTHPVTVFERKGAPGEPSLPISGFEFAQAVGRSTAATVVKAAQRLYVSARTTAATRGLVLADTTFEFGVNEDSEAIELGDDVITPDTSHFWLASKYRTGAHLDSYDTELVADWLRNEWEGDPKSSEALPELPPDIVEKTRQRYVEVYRMLTGTPWKKDQAGLVVPVGPTSDAEVRLPEPVTVPAGGVHEPGAPESLTAEPVSAGPVAAEPLALEATDDHEVPPAEPGSGEPGTLPTQPM